jgi:hypothetical protein
LSKNSASKTQLEFPTREKEQLIGMLKTLKPTEPELIRLCRAKTWMAVAHRSKSHPEEAVPTASAIYGAGTTALAIAVRASAPIRAVEALIKADANQVTVFHKFSGSILHEALKHGAPYNVLRILLQAMIHQEGVLHGDDENYLSLLARQDELGRSVLHHSVVRAMREIRQDGDLSEMWVLFRSILLAYPPAVQIMDMDGNTPLVMALLLPTSATAVVSEEDEAYVLRMVQLMVATWPSATTIARKVKKLWKRPHDKTNSPPTTGDGAPIPLSYAILYGRSETTIKVLLDAHGKVGLDAGLTLVSGYAEVPLHVATSLRSPVTLLQNLMENEPKALLVRDIFHLTPLDWMWIRHVVDWCSAEPPFVTVMPSTRRYLSPHFAGWHDRTTKELNTNNNSVLQEALLERMRLLLPAAARAATDEPVYKQGEPWSLLHSACFVSCPLAIVRLACKQKPHTLKIRDSRAGRLPLHYAAARFGYLANVPVGVSREVRSMMEPSPAMELATKFVQATRVVDAENQLPLHIAIETAKRVNDNEVVKELIRLYPCSLERRDGKTKLYPFLHAATGPDGSFGLSFSLLRERPTLVASGIPVDTSRCALD